MVQFLVLARCGLDDIPMGLFDDQEAADAYCVDLLKDGPKGAEDAIRAQAGHLGLDTSVYFRFAVIRMEGTSPIQWTTTHELYPDEPEAAIPAGESIDCRDYPA